MTPVKAVAHRSNTALPQLPLRVVEDEATPKGSPQRRVGRRAPIIGLLVFVGMLALAASHTLLVQGQIRLDGLDEKVAAQQEDYHRARLEVAELEAPERIVTAAMERIGMVEPADVVYLTPEESEPIDEAPSVEADETWIDVKPYLEPGT